jgi:hypothetical protein
MDSMIVVNRSARAEALDRPLSRCLLSWPLEALGCAPRPLQRSFPAREDLLDALVDPHERVVWDVTGGFRSFRLAGHSRLLPCRPLTASPSGGAIRSGDRVKASAVSGDVRPIDDRAEALGVSVAGSPGDAAPGHAAPGRVVGVVGAVEVELPQAGELRLDAVIQLV